MRRIVFVLAVAAICLGISGLMLAQDNPLLGTWKVNLEKSKFASGMAPKSLTRTVSADGDKVTYSFEGESNDGTAMKYGFTVMYDGKDYEISGSGMPFGADHIAIKRINSHNYSATLKRDGKAVATSASTVSKDGKMTTLKMAGKDAKDQQVESTVVYDKQ